MGSQEPPATRTTRHTMFTLLLLLGLATSSPIGRSTRQTNMVLIQAREGQTQPQSRQDFGDIDVPAGEAVDIFYRYGFFSLSVRVVPRDDHGLGSSGNQPPKFSRQILFARSSNL